MDKVQLRACFLIHHKGHKEHKGLTLDGKNSCKFAKFVAEICPKGKSTESKRVSKHSLRGVRAHG
jgi:hypothetical protein